MGPCSVSCRRSAAGAWQWGLGFGAWGNVAHWPTVLQRSPATVLAAYEAARERRGIRARQDEQQSERPGCGLRAWVSFLLTMGE